MQISKKNLSGLIFLRVCLLGLFLCGCRSTPETKPQVYRVICDEELAEVLQPIIPQAQAVYGELRVEFLPQEKIQERILATDADAWFTLDNRLGLDYLLEPYEDKLPHKYVWKLSTELPFDKTLLMYELYDDITTHSTLSTAVNALKAAGLEAQLTQYNINYPVWENVMNDQMRLLETLVIDRIRFKRAELKEVMSGIWAKGNAIDPEMPLPEIRYELTSEPAIAPITLELRNVTVLDALKTVTEISGLYFKLEGEQVVIYRIGVCVLDNDVYVFPPDKMRAFFTRYGEGFFSPQFEGCWGPPVPEPPLSEVEKLNVWMSRYGYGRHRVIDYDLASGFMDVRGAAEERGGFEQLLRQIYFWSPEALLMERR